MKITSETFNKIANQADVILSASKSFTSVRRTQTAFLSRIKGIKPQVEPRTLIKESTQGSSIKPRSRRKSGISSAYNFEYVLQTSQNRVSRIKNVETKRGILNP